MIFLSCAVHVFMIVLNGLKIAPVAVKVGGGQCAAGSTAGGRC